MKLYQIRYWDEAIKRFYPLMTFPLLKTEAHAQLAIERLEENPRNDKHKFQYAELNVFEGEVHDKTNHA